MELDLKPKAIDDLRFFKRSGNRATVRKIDKILHELETDPENGTGKPEQLKYDLSGMYSRRLNYTDRIVYEIDYDNNMVHIYSFRGHY